MHPWIALLARSRKMDCDMEKVHGHCLLTQGRRCHSCVPRPSARTIERGPDGAQTANSGAQTKLGQISAISSVVRSRRYPIPFHSSRSSGMALIESSLHWAADLFALRQASHLCANHFPGPPVGRQGNCPMLEMLREACPRTVRGHVRHDMPQRL